MVINAHIWGAGWLNLVQLAETPVLFKGMIMFERG
jgi:hypothetical protein